MRQLLLTKFINNDVANYIGLSSNEFAYVKIAGDASFRNYYRLTVRDSQSAKKNDKAKSYIIMDAPPEHEKIPEFIDIATLLRDIGLNAPEIYLADEQHGFLLIEDFGDNILDSYINSNGDKKSAELKTYHQAIDVLIHLQQQSSNLITRNQCSNIAHYSKDILLQELSLFSQWYLPEVYTNQQELLESQAEFIQIWQEILSKYEYIYNSELNNFVVLRDYHAQNIIYLPEREQLKQIGLLDFQDALIGNPAYDIASLLQDARREISPQLEQKLLHYWLGNHNRYDGFSRRKLENSYRILSVQRNCKIIGIFYRLHIRDGKSSYLHYIDRVWGYILRTITDDPELSSLRVYFESLKLSDADI